MNKTKNILLVSTLSLLGLTLASCSKEEKRNQIIPYETITEDVVAQAKGVNVTEKELYNKLRYNYGLQVFNKKLDTLLYGDQIANVKYEGDVKVEIDEEIAKAVYNTTELPKLKLMSDDDAKLARKKFVDKMARQGLRVTEEELVFDPITKQTENVSFSKLSATTIEYYKLSQAKKLRGKEYIESVCDNEYITKNDKEVKNNYYISDKKIEARYESNYRKHNTAKGIILRFANAEDAYRAIEDVADGARELNKAIIEQQYVDLYNEYYNYEDKLEVSQVGINENTVFKTNSEVEQLTAFSPNVNKLFIEHLEDGEGLLKPVNIDDKYYLVFRKDVTFKTGGSKDIPFSQIPAEQLPAIKESLKKDIIDSESSNVSSTIYTEDLENKELKIYDPFIENNFAAGNSFYEYVAEGNNKYIFNSNDSKFSYTTEEFYKDLLNYDVDSAVVEIILNKYLYKNEKAKYLKDDEEKKIKDELNTEIKDFNKGSKNLNKAYGEANYLFFQYGVTTQDEVIVLKSASNIKSDYIVDFINDEWANSDHTINESKTLILNNLIDSAEAIIKEQKLFDINLDHILISIDNDQDGNPDNMLEFVDKLSDAQKADFEKAINELSHAIAREVAAIDRPNTKEKLDFIVKAFNNNWVTAEGKNWSEYKKYHFSLKAEELGNIDEATVKNFVKEFKDYVEALFDKAVRDDLKIPYEKEKDGRLYFTDRIGADGKVEKQIDSTNFEVKDLCLTQFGYHMVSLNSYKKDSTKLNFKFTENQDTTGDYKNIKVILDEKDKDDKNDDIYIVTDIYNDDQDRPSMDQVLIYFVEKTNGDVTSIKTSIKNNLSTLLDDVITKFKSDSFQNYLLLKQLGEITAVELPQFDYNRYIEYTKNSNENYDKDSYYYNHWYDNTFDWTK